MIVTCSYESRTARGWPMIEADLMACWWETGDPALLRRWLAIRGVA